MGCAPSKGRDKEASAPPRTRSCSHSEELDAATEAIAVRWLLMARASIASNTTVCILYQRGTPMFGLDTPGFGCLDSFYD